ncbi:MAG: acyl-CoA dehydrogenase, partial [Thermoleophilia bacterium]|nr:acyl-CoA dehydrogenase [Thermoleophilia bacterium]
KLGLRGQATAELFLSDVRVPDSAVLGEVGQGFKIAMGTLDKGRLAVGAGCVGIVQGCLETSVDYAKTRLQFGKPIAGFQSIAFALADLTADLEAARLLTYKAAWEKDQGLEFTQTAAIAKLKTGILAREAANLNVQIHGGYGYMDEYAASRFYRDAKILEIGEGTNEVQRMVIARGIGIKLH